MEIDRATFIRYINSLPEQSIVNTAHKACHSPENLNVLELLFYLDRIADPRINQGHSLLHTAAYHHNMDACSLLLKKGFSINIRDDNGQTPLHHLSCNDQHLEMIQWFLDQGADPNEGDDESQTPLYLAAKYGASKVVEVLLEHQANPLITNDLGDEPFNAALRNNHTNIARIITERKKSIPVHRT